MKISYGQAWILTGGITYTMCVAQYLTPHGGFKSYLDSRNIHAKTDFEEATTYVSATILGCTLHLVLLDRGHGAETAAYHAGRQHGQGGGFRTLPVERAGDGQRDDPKAEELTRLSRAVDANDGGGSGLLTVGAQFC